MEREEGGKVGRGMLTYPPPLRCFKLFFILSSAWACSVCMLLEVSFSPFTFHLGFVHPLQDVALPLSSVCSFSAPGGSLLAASLA